MTVHLCRPTSVASRKVLHCPTCKKRRRFVVRSFVWYSTIATCCACGDAWSDGYRLPRPFKPNWRAEAAARAKADWQTALAPAAAQRAIRRMMEAQL